MANLQRSPQAAPPPQAAALAESKLEVTAQILSFEPGLYSVDVLAPQIRHGVSGMVVPCVRLDPVNAGEAGRAFVSTLAESPLIEPGGAATYLRVQGAKASVLLTIYKLAGGMAAPELRISLVQSGGARTADAKPAAALPSEPLTLMAHVERAGDVSVQGGHWAGQPGGRGAIEGFSVTPGNAVKPDDIEYQAVLGSDWTTPWLAGGEFCGSRGLSLPLLGARIRLRGEAAKAFSVSYWGSFIGGGEIGPIADGAVCGGGGAALEALRVVVRRRQVQGGGTLVGHPLAASSNVTNSTEASKPKAMPQIDAVKPGKVTTLKPNRSKPIRR